LGTIKQVNKKTKQGAEYQNGIKMASSRPMYHQQAPRNGIVLREWSAAQFASKANIAVAPRFQKPQPRSADSTFEMPKDVDCSLERLTPPSPQQARRYRHDPYSRVCSRVEVSPPAPRMMELPTGRFSPITPPVAPLVRAFQQQQQQQPVPLAPAPTPAPTQASRWVMRDGRRVPVSVLSRVM
jgi:hypothetical protein